MRELVKSVFSKIQMKTFFEFCSNTSCNFQKTTQMKYPFLLLLLVLYILQYFDVSQYFCVNAVCSDTSQTVIKCV